MKEVNQIVEALCGYNEELSKRYHLKIVGVFGSYVRGEQEADSDIDVLVEIEKPISLLELVGAEIWISELLDTKVDLIPKEDLRQEIRETILSEAIYL